MTIFYFVLVTLTPNFEDDNTVSSFGKTIENLLSILESENEMVMWLLLNKLNFNHHINNIYKSA